MEWLSRTVTRGITDFSTECGEGGNSVSRPATPRERRICEDVAKTVMQSEDCRAKECELKHHRAGGGSQGWRVVGSRD